MPRGLLSWLCLTAMAAWAAGQSSTECRLCHRAEAEHFALSGMAQALFGTAASDVLHGHSRLTARIGGYSYEIARAGGRAIYSVTDGKDNVQSAPHWAFGSGEAGQTLVFQRDGQWVESRVSYFLALDNLDLTMGAQNSAPRNLAEAAGRLMSPADTASCFGCHATNAVKASELTLADVKPGVQWRRV